MNSIVAAGYWTPGSLILLVPLTTEQPDLLKGFKLEHNQFAWVNVLHLSQPPPLSLSVPPCLSLSLSVYIYIYIYIYIYRLLSPTSLSLSLFPSFFFNHLFYYEGVCRVLKLFWFPERPFSELTLAPTCEALAQWLTGAYFNSLQFKQRCPFARFANCGLFIKFTTYSTPSSLGFGPVSNEKYWYNHLKRVASVRIRLNDTRPIGSTRCMLIYLSILLSIYQSLSIISPSLNCSLCLFLVSSFSV